ncbi:MAG: DsbE family thiol:disulfide interchange protein [Hyphomicrobiales bacterium]|nr:DsbE family thiol:disulfide interchange protein [Hyphomicrobiales bacterium]
MSAPELPAGTGPRRRLRLLAFLPLALFLGLAAVFVVRLFTGDPTKLPSALIGRPAPTFTLPPVEGLVRDGRPVPGFGQADLATGRPVLVNVFASWCAPCHQEHPLLMDLARDGRFTILGINQKDRPENARRFLGRLGNPYSAVGADGEGRVSIEWGVYGVPETFLVSGDGRILYKHVGPLTPDSIRNGLLPEITRALATR